MIERVPQLVVYGILSGGVYGLLAMGLSLQYGVCRVLNITHGEFVMLGAMLTFTISVGFNINPLLTPLIIGPLLFVVGFLLQATLFRGLKARAPSQPVFEGSALLITFGLMYVIQYTAIMNWGAQQQSTVYLADKVSFLGMTLFLNQIVAFAIAAALGVVVYLFLTHSRLGRAIRATAEDPATAGLMGVNTNMVLALCFGLGALLAGIAGTLVSIKVQARTGIGFENTVIALIVVTLGGLGSVPGSFIAGILVGIASSLVIGLWEPILAIPVYYVILMVLLLVKPTGILGKK